MKKRIYNTRQYKNKYYYSGIILWLLLWRSVGRKCCGVLLLEGVGRKCCEVLLLEGCLESVLGE